MRQLHSLIRPFAEECEREDSQFFIEGRAGELYVAAVVPFRSLVPLTLLPSSYVHARR